MAIQYLQLVKQLTPRALSMLDWEQTSISQGSFDRTWWCWKFTDFSAPRLQEGVFLLSWLATEPNSFYPSSKREKLIEMSVSAINFWSTLQHCDGSFDEAYPNERSLAATAFSTFYIGSALECLQGYISQQQYFKFSKCLELSGVWLARNGEYHGILSNHLAAAAAALQVIGDVCQTHKFNKDRDRYLQTIFQNQHPKEEPLFVMCRYKLYIEQKSSCPAFSQALSAIEIQTRSAPRWRAEAWCSIAAATRRHRHGRVGRRRGGLLCIG